MQHKLTTKYQRIISVMIATVWTAGLLMAGSDSPYMPWTNILGLILFLAASILLSKGFRRIRPETVAMTFPKIHYRPAPSGFQSLKKNRRMRIRYALGG